MKTHILYTALAAFAVSSISASAQEGDRPQRDIPPEVLAKFDSDGDGKLTGDERKEAMKARKTQMEERRAAWEAMTPEEREAKKAEMKANYEALLKKYDGAVEGTKADGKLDREEMKLAREAGEKLPPRRPQARGGRDGKSGPGGRDGRPGPGGRDGKPGPGGKGRPGGNGGAGN